MTSTELPEDDERRARAAGRDEMNLAEFPFASLVRQSGDRDAYTYEGWITDREGRRQRQRWTVRGAGGLGLPTEYDERVLVALMALSAELGFHDRKVPFSVYSVIQLMGVPRSKRAYEAVERSLERLVGVTIYAEGAFWDHGEKTWVRLKSGFHIIDKFWLAYLEPDEQVRSAEGVPGYFVWSEDIWKSIQDGYIKHLDIGFYFRLEGPLARRLYRFLDKRMAFQTEYEIDIFDLAGRLGMARYAYPSKVLEKLQPALDELIARGYLRRAEVVRVKKYTRLRFERVPPSPSSPPLATPDADVAEASLVALGFGEATARELLARYTPPRILEKLDFLRWLQATLPRTVRSPQGWLRRAIEEDWGAPIGYHRPASGPALPPMSDEVPSPAVTERLGEQEATAGYEREVWRAVQRDLEGQMTRATFDRLFPQTRLLHVDEGEALIGVPNETVQEWLAVRYQPMVSTALARHLGDAPVLRFVRLQPDEWD